MFCAKFKIKLDKRVFKWTVDCKEEEVIKTLKEKICNVCKTVDFDKIIFKYNDVDGDLVDLLTVDNLQEALMVSKNKKEDIIRIIAENAESLPDLIRIIAENAESLPDLQNDMTISEKTKVQQQTIDANDSEDNIVGRIVARNVESLLDQNDMTISEKTRVQQQTIGANDSEDNIVGRIVAKNVESLLDQNDMTISKKTELKQQTIDANDSEDNIVGRIVAKNVESLPDLQNDMTISEKTKVQQQTIRANTLNQNDSGNVKSLKRERFDDNNDTFYKLKKRRISINNNNGNILPQGRYNINKYYMGNNYCVNNHKNNPKELITTFINNASSIWLWLCCFLSYFNYCKNQNVINKQSKNKLAILWKDIYQKYEQNCNNKFDLECEIQFIILEFIECNNLFCFKFYHKLQKSFYQSNCLLDYFKIKFPDEATCTLTMAKTFANIFIKRVHELDTGQLLLLLQIYIEDMQETNSKSYDKIFEGILDIIFEKNMSGKDFTNTIEELITLFGYYDNNKFHEHQLVLYEIWNFFNDY